MSADVEFVTALDDEVVWLGTLDGLLVAILADCTCVFMQDGKAELVEIDWAKPSEPVKFMGSQYDISVLT